MLDVMFHLSAGSVIPMAKWEPPYERYVQETIERDMPILLHCRLIQSEFPLFGGQYRIDSLGLDDQLRPVIVEYKARGEAPVVNQALYYKNALIKSKESFMDAVSKAIGPIASDHIRWDAITIICIAPSFDFFEKEMITSLNDNIDLIEYTFFAKDLLHLKTVAGMRNKSFGVSSVPVEKNSYEQMEKMLSARSSTLLNKLIMRTCSINSSIAVIKTQDALEFHYDDLLARVVIDNPDSPKIRVLICGLRDELGIDDDIQSRKTPQGVVITLKNDDYLDHIMNAIHQCHDRLSIANN